MTIKLLTFVALLCSAFLLSLSFDMHNSSQSAMGKSCTKYAGHFCIYYSIGRTVTPYPVRSRLSEGPMVTLSAIYQSVMHESTRTLEIGKRERVTYERDIFYFHQPPNPTPIPVVVW